MHRHLIPLILEWPELFKTITADNGTEFHGYRQVERATGVTIYFATPTVPGNAARTRNRTV